MVPTHRPVLREECARRDRHCQSTSRVEATTQIAESFHLLNVISKLVREFARQSPKEPMPSAIVKAAYMRVVPETYRRAMETQVDVDKVEPHNLEDKVLAFIRNNTSGAAPMDMGNIAPGQTTTLGLGSSSQSTTSSSHGGSDSYPDLNNYEYAAQWGQDWNTGDVFTMFNRNNLGSHGELNTNFHFALHLLA